MKRPSTHRVRRLAELRAMASPQRQELLSAIETLQPCSVRAAGRFLGRLPVSLYYHLRKLEEVGLVIKEGDEEGETLYRLPARQLRIEPDKRGKGEVDAMRKIGAGVFRRAQRLYDEAVSRDPRDEHLMAQRTVRLSKRGRERVHKKLLELLTAVNEERASKGGAFYTLTLHFAANEAHGDPE